MKVIPLRQSYSHASALVLDFLTETFKEAHTHLRFLKAV